MTMLAEIADKMPTFWGTAVIDSVIACFACVLGMFRWWLIVPFMLLAAFANYVQWSQLQESGFGQLIYDELGVRWIAGQFAAGNLPFMAMILIVACVHRRHCRDIRRLSGLCVRCGYNLTGNVSGICPECGDRI
jgi:hypothetical protein